MDDFATFKDGFHLGRQRPIKIALFLRNLSPRTRVTREQAFPARPGLILGVSPCRASGYDPSPRMASPQQYRRRDLPRTNRTLPVTFQRQALALG